MSDQNKNQNSLLEKLSISSSPQINSGSSTASIMWTVSLCLAPAGLWGIFVFGLKALIVILVSVLSCMLTEALIGFFMKKMTLRDGSAFLTGLLISFNMPPEIPLYIPVVASVFAIAVVKWSFGGLGSNWMNPALAGRVFVAFSWAAPMGKWTFPSLTDTVSKITADAVSAPTALGAVKMSMLDHQGALGSPIAFLKNSIYSNFPDFQYPSAMDSQLSAWLNENIFRFFSTHLPDGYIDLFIGNIPGCIGEISALLLLLGTIYLFAKKIITWEIPLAYMGSFALLVWVFGGLPLNNGFFSGDILFHFFTGGLILGVFYMATDMATTPLSSKGMLIFGAGAGLMTFLIRCYGSLPEGVSMAIILMNVFVPLINRFTQPRIFGHPKKRQKT